MKNLKDPFIEWLVSTSEFKRRVWIIEAQLYRIVLKIIKNEDFKELFETTESEIFTLEHTLPLTMCKYIDEIDRSLIKTLYIKFDRDLNNFTEHVKQTKGFI